MNRNIKTISIIVSLIMDSMVLFANDLFLNNRTFTGTSGIKNSETVNYDTLYFKNGNFSSKHCKQWGFKPNRFKKNIIGNKIFFKVNLTSDENGTLFWKGVIEDKKIKANYIWTKKFLFWEIKKEYWFKGNETIKAK